MQPNRRWVRLRAVFYCPICPRLVPCAHGQKETFRLPARAVGAYHARNEGQSGLLPPCAKAGAAEGRDGTTPGTGKNKYIWIWRGSAAPINRICTRFLVKNLLDPDWRKEYQLTPPECPKPYQRIHERHFRREIAFVHREIWGKNSKKESSSLWQHWRHQNYRLTRAQKGTIVVSNCHRCFRGKVYVGPCYCLLDRANLKARETGRQGVKIAVTKRKCMRCGNAFLSEGRHNRLCLKCRRPQRGLDDLI